MKIMELYQDKIIGAIRGLDRIRFRGTLRLLANQNGLSRFMSFTNVLLKDFGGWAEGLTAMIRQSCRAKAEELGIETHYLRRASIDKEKLAREIAESRGIKEGSICMFSAVEPCIAPMVKGNKAQKKLQLVMAQRKCVFVYHYFDDPVFGFGHVRIQSWLPFNIFICLNGRRWLEKQLQKQGIGYIKDGNCFPWIEDVKMAQKLLDEQLKSDWKQILDRLAFGSCPALSQVLRPLRPDYYLSADETEWATDIMFKSVKSLDELYRSLLHHAMHVCDSPSVMRYFGRRRLGGLYPKSERLEKQEKKKYSGRTTRLIKLLRVHGLIKKVAKENRYMLTAKGQKFAGALMAASVVDIKALTEIAA